MDIFAVQGLAQRQVDCCYEVVLVPFELEMRNLADFENKIRALPGDALVALSLEDQGSA